MTWNITPRIERIVLDLAKNGPATGYEIAERTEISRSSAYDALKKHLLEWECVEIHPVPEWTGFLEKKKYSLTVIGFSLALDLTKPEEYRTIIERWPDLVPLVTGNWSLFIKGGVEDRALSMLGIAASHVLSDVFHDPIDLGHSRDFVEMFSQNFYNPNYMHFSPEDDSRWVEACAHDSVVRDYFNDGLTMIIEKNKMMMNYAENLKMQMMAQALKDKKDSSSTTV